MAKAQTISWIFLSIALASQNGKADLNEISDAADFINHSIPSQKEMKLSIDWLTNKHLISKIENKYQLTNLGTLEYEKASQKTKVLFEIWKKLEIGIMKEVK